jgi:hypothetical protein
MKKVISELRSTPRKKYTLVGAIFLAFFVALAFWGGAPPTASIPAFAAGVVILALVLLAFALAAWHLMIRPLPARHRRPELRTMRASYRRLLATLAGLAGINLVVGGFWDEVWHRQYGIPFGQDLFWRPHLLIYSSIAIIMGLAFWALMDMFRHGQGSLQQRFRANPIVGLLVIVGAFLAFALPADPIWHILYGEDISALSIPHVVLTLSFSLVMVLAVAIQQSTVPARRWRFIGRPSLRDALAMVLLAFVLLIGLQALTSDWDGGSLRALQERPQWLLPAIIVAMATLIGTTANHALRTVGVASLTGLLAITIRLSLIAMFGNPEVGTGAWYAALPPLLALDAWYGLRLKGRGRAPAALSSGVAAMAGMALVSFALVNRFYAYPTISPANLLPILLTGMAAAIGASWVGQTLGDFLGLENKDLEPAGAGRRALRLIPPAAFAGVIGFIVLFILTAAPPV